MIAIEGLGEATFRMTGDFELLNFAYTKVDTLAIKRETKWRAWRGSPDLSRGETRSLFLHFLSGRRQLKAPKSANWKLAAIMKLSLNRYITVEDEM